MTPEGQERLLLLDKLERLTWWQTVHARFMHAMAAAAAGEPIDWQVWARIDRNEIDEAGLCEFSPVEYAEVPKAGLALRPYSSEDVWQNTLDFTADLERYKAEHGPFLRELRGSWMAVGYLAAVLPKAESGPSSAAAFLGVPVITDHDVRERYLRLVYSDSTTRDVEVISAATYEGLLAKLREIKPPGVAEFEFKPDPGVFAPHYRCGRCFTPVYVPGYCGWCKTLPPPPSNIASIITGI